MYNITVIGSGILGLKQITPEGVAAIKKSEECFWIGKIDGIQDLILSENIKAENLSGLYINGENDTDNYERIITRLYKAMKIRKNIALIVPGHPRVGVTIVQKLSDEKSIKLVCYPGISSFDTMINDLSIDPLEEGTCILDANRLILYDYFMESSINYFIYHVCSVGNVKTDFLDPTENNRVNFLIDKLSKHYPPDHKLYLLSSSTSISEKANKIEGKTGSLKKLLEKVTYNHTLFIPSILPKKEDVNFEFLKCIQP